MVQSLTEKGHIIFTIINGFFTRKYCRYIMEVWFQDGPWLYNSFLDVNLSLGPYKYMQTKQIIKIYILKCRNNNREVLCQNTNMTLDKFKKCFHTHNKCSPMLEVHLSCSTTYARKQKLTVLYLSLASTWSCVISTYA